MAAELKVAGTPGEIYEQHMVPAIFARWAPDLVDVAGVRAGQRVLDVACGTGVVSRLLAERVGPTGRVVGLDFNAGMLAAGRVAASNVAIEWLEGNAMNMPLPNAVFDVVVCQQGLQFVPDKLAALREMRRVLVPSGRLAISLWRSVEHAPGFRVLEETLARRIGSEKAALPPFSLSDAQTVHNMVTDAGFQNVRVHADVKMSRFQSAEHFVRSIVGGSPSMLGALAALGPAVLDSIVAEVVEGTRSYLDTEGWATAQVTNIITAVA